MIINVTKNSIGDSVMEVWNEDKKITVYFPETCDVLCVHGKEVGSDITDDMDFYDAWKWITDNI